MVHLKINVDGPACVMHRLTKKERRRRRSIIRKMILKKERKKIILELRGIDPRTSHMLSERSTIWATAPDG